VYVSCYLSYCLCWNVVYIFVCTEMSLYMFLQCVVYPYVLVNLFYLKRRFSNRPLSCLWSSCMCWGVACPIVFVKEVLFVHLSCLRCLFEASVKKYIFVEMLLIHQMSLPTCRFSVCRGFSIPVIDAGGHRVHLAGGMLNTHLHLNFEIALNSQIGLFLSDM